MRKKGINDDWIPTTTVSILKLRAQIFAKVRQFFEARHILEVETPLLSESAVTDPYLHSFQTEYYNSIGEKKSTLYLQTSPEFAMKRLLAFGSGPIYQITKAFRNRGERGRWHNPEFSMLEWYRPNFTLAELMDEVEALLHLLFSFSKAQRWTYAEIFEHFLNINPHYATLQQLRPIAEQQGVSIANIETITRLEDWLQLLLDEIIEHSLDKETPIFIYDFPATQAALARIRIGDPPIAERVEVYLGGLELANGFYELADATEQQQRFQNDQRLRQAQSLPIMPIDKRFLAALTYGLPDCSGIALGLDRLIAYIAKANALADVISFPIEAA